MARYLRSVVAVARSARRHEYAVVHFGSGSFFRTDRLGAAAARALIAGRSDVEAVALAEGMETGAGERARRLILGLDSKGAMTSDPPRGNGGRWHRRHWAAIVAGTALSILGPLVRLAPIPILVWMFRILPSIPITRHIWRGVRGNLINNLRASGYGNLSEASLLEISRRCVADWQSNYLFMYLGTVLSTRRLSMLVDRLFDRTSAHVLATEVRRTGATVGAFMHGPLCVAVPNVLRSQVDVVRVVVPWTHGNNVSETSGPLTEFFGDSMDMTVALNEPLASGDLLRHMKAGRSVYIGLDRLAQETKATAEIELLGHGFPRSDGPAWLAVKSGRPLAFWTTYSAPSGIVVSGSPPIYPDPSLPVEQRVAALSQQVYAYAEAAIREHPEAWAGWGYLNHLTGIPISAAPTALGSATTPANF